jgi:phospholipase C
VPRRLPVFFALSAVAVSGFMLFGHTGKPRAHSIPLAGIHKIRHVVVVMQENRSFDSYFGTYPGADGLPRRNGRFTVCSPDPRTHICVYPFHDRLNRNIAGPHEHVDALRDIDGGRMDGFIRQARRGLAFGCERNPALPICSVRSHQPDVMGYHDWHEIPNYWDYARHFVLMDHMFEPATSWSLPSHLFMVSEWSARCHLGPDPTGCVNAPGPT